MQQTGVALDNGLQPADVGAGDFGAMMPTAPFSWQKGRQIGQGGFGTVYMGLVHATGQVIAVKQVSLPRDPANTGQVQIFTLEREVAVLRKLRHENIVRYLGTERTAEHLNIFLEYVAGGSLSNKLSQFGSLREETIRVYTKQILRGVQYLHQHRVMHRDIKGANILVDTNGVVKLADFGASKQLEDLATIGGGARSLHGTAHWMAPEVIRQQGHGCQADIWSLACVVIEMATGRPPWSEYKNPHSVMYHVASTRDLPPMPEWLSPAAKDFLTLCFNRVPRERPNATRLLQHPWMQGVVIPRANNVAPSPLPVQAPPPAQAADSAPALQPAQPFAYVSSPVKEQPDSNVGLVVAGMGSPAAVRPAAVPPLRLDVMKQADTPTAGSALPGSQRAPLPALATASNVAPSAPPLSLPIQQPDYGAMAPNAEFSQPEQKQRPRDPIMAGVQLAASTAYPLTGNPYDSMSSWNPVIEPSYMPSQNPAQLAFERRLRQLASVPEQSSPDSPTATSELVLAAPAAARGGSAGGDGSGALAAPVEGWLIVAAPTPPLAHAPAAESAAAPIDSVPRKGAGAQRGTAHGTKTVVVPSRPPLAGIFAAAYEDQGLHVDGCAAAAANAVPDREFSPRDQAPKHQAASQAVPHDANIKGGGGGGTLDPARAKQWRDELEAELAAERKALTAAQRDPEVLLSARAVIAGRPSVADL